MANRRVSQLNNAYTVAQNEARKRDAWKQRKRRVHKRRFIVILALLALITIFGTVRYIRLHEQQTAVAAKLKQEQTKLSRTKAHRKSLEVRVDQLNSEDYLAKLVRSQYYASRPGEVIFTLPTSVNQIPGTDTAK